MTLLSRLKPNLLDRYIAREIIPPTFLGLVLFTFILLLQQITLLTGFLISRNADLFTVLRLFLYLLPSFLATTIPMAFLLGVLLAFGRLASESEIVAMRASGVSPARLLRPVMALSTVAAGITFYITAVGSPNANQAFRELFFSVTAGSARSSVRPRVFNDDLLPSGAMVLYVSDIASHSSEWRNLFLYDNRTPSKPKVILARSGSLVTDYRRKEARLDLRHGTAYAFQADEPDRSQESAFDFQEVRLPFEELFPGRISISKGHTELTLADVRQRIRELTAQRRPRKEMAPFYVEWHKRLAIPVACFVFGLLGLGLSLGTRKEARSAAFGLSIAVIFLYYVFIRLGEQAGDTGLMPPLIAIWSANAVLGAIAVLLLYLNHREAAFDPLDASLYTRWIPRPRLRFAKRRPAVSRGPIPHGPARRGRLGSLLDAYIARSYVGHLALVVVAFWSLYLLAEFMDLFDDVQQNKVKGLVVVMYYLFHAPAILHLIAPVGILVATLTTLGVLARRNEITAMKAGGVSVYRATVPVVAVALLGSFTLFTLGEFILPDANRAASGHFDVIKGRPPRATSYLHRRWILGTDNRFYNYEHMLPGTELRPLSLYNLSVYDVDPGSWRLHQRLFAGSARWTPVVQLYDLERGWRRVFGDQPAFHPFDAVRTREIDAPDYFQREDRGSETLGFVELRSHIASLERMGVDVVKLRVQLHKKVAFPAVSVVMALIGIPFSFVVGRRGALYGIGVSILIAIVYWACLGIFEALGANALLPPLLAAWAPNLIFGAAGLYLMLNLET